MQYYAVAYGLRPGVYTDHFEFLSQVHRIPGARFKSFTTLDAADNWVSQIRDIYDQSDHDSDSDYDYDYKPQDHMYHELDFGLLETLPPRIYTDGACRYNHDRSNAKAGVGVFFGTNDPRNISRPATGEQTNQRAELEAIQLALSLVADEVEHDRIRKYQIVSDSQYAINAITEWSKKWKRNGWLNAKGEPVSNQDIIKGCILELDYINRNFNSRFLTKLKFLHVKGHSGDYGNEQADMLAIKGSYM